MTKRLSLGGRLRIAAACPDANAPLFAEAAEAIEQHEAYKQKVSDAMEEYCKFMPTHFPPILNQFIIPAPKPDPLVEVMKTFGSVSNAEDFRAALDALGLEIRSKAND